jgi:hypothetical protein
MQTFASTTRSEHSSGTKTHHSTAQPDTEHHDPVTTFYSPAIFRKAACSCGGGCPSCQSGASSLKISQPTDAAEIEADQVADRVMRMPLAAAKPESKLSNTANTIHRKCAACEDEEEEAAETPVMRKEASVSATPPPPADTPPSIKNVMSSGGQPLDRETRNFFEPRFGADLGHVRIHTGSAAAQSARAINARAYTLGNRIVFANSEYRPDGQSGAHLLAHELAHVMQQTTDANRNGNGLVATRVATPVLARSVDQWLSGSLNIAGLSYTQLIDEIDELNQWVQRQTTSSPDTARIEESLGLLRAEVTRRDRAAAGPSERGRRGRRGTRTTPTTGTEPLPARYPRVLTEMTSVAYENPAEMRAEYDLIMQWLARPELSASERRILTVERDNLAPQLNIDRERVAGERHAARVRGALTPPDPEAVDALTNLARTIQSISAEPDNPAVFYIYHQGERIAISREQAEGLRTNLRSELRRATTRIDSDAQGYWSRYNSQLALNRDSPLIAAITGWLANVEDPREELSSRYFWIRMRVRTMLDLLEAGRMLEAATLMASVEQVGQEIRSLARTFYEGHIEGAEMAIRGLTITRDVSFAIAGSIAAVVAAPVVAGAVGVGGLGLTGASATIATIGGTGVVVGSGVGLVRGTSSAVGTLGAGGSWAEVGEAFTSEAATGFREGFLAGAGGAAGRSLGLAIGVGGSLTRQAAMRVGGEMLINGTTAMADSLWRSCRSPAGCDVNQAAQAAVIAAAAAAPGALIGGSNNPIVRNLVAPFTAAGTSYLAARASGASSEDALIQAGAALAAHIAISSATHGADADAALVERGRSIGARVRETTVSAGRTARSYVAATMIGMADALPPARSGYGGTAPALVETVPARAGRVGASPPPETTSPTTVPTETAPSPAAVAPRETAPVEPTVPPAREAPSVPPPTTPPPDVEAPIPSRRSGRGATAEGMGDEFRYEYHRDAPDPVVETGPGSARRGAAPETSTAPPRPTGETETAAPRRSTSSEIEAELAETSGGTSRGSSSSDPDELNAPGPRQADDVEGLQTEPEGGRYSGFAQSEEELIQLAQELFPEYQYDPSTRGRVVVRGGRVYRGRGRPRGSTVPDLYLPGSRGGPGSRRRPPISLESKNYYVGGPESYEQFMLQTLDQVRRRAAALPRSAQQHILIDLRGQDLTRDFAAGLRRELAGRSGGLLRPDRIHFIPRSLD